MPEINVAIEYHGNNTLSQLIFFGGEKAFKATVERDKRKASICKKHNVYLIVVTKGYDINNIAEQIDNNISSIS